jgi:hypothetical protein
VARGEETPGERVERLIREGLMPREAVAAAQRLWWERLRQGVPMPNGDTAIITLRDLFHVIVDPRIWRRPDRIEHMLQGIFEIRTGEFRRRVGLARWEEDGRELVGVVILEADNRLRSMHVVDERKLRRATTRGELVWRL